MSFRVETGHWERRLASCLIWAPHSSGRSDLCGIGRPPWRTHLVSSIENSVAHSVSSRSMILRDRSFGLSEIKTSCRWSLSRWERCPSCRFLLRGISSGRWSWIASGKIIAVIRINTELFTELIYGIINAIARLVSLFDSRKNLTLSNERYFPMLFTKLLNILILYLR